MRRAPSLSWILLGLAVFAWLAIAMLAWAVYANRTAFAKHVRDAASSAKSGADAQNIRSHVMETEGDVAQFNTMLQVDPVAFVKTIQAAGLAAGADVHISNAFPESVPSKAKPKDAPSIYGFGFTVETQSSFAALMRIIQVLDSLPAPSSIGQIEIEHVGDGSQGAGEWKLKARIRVLTSNNISS